MLHNRGYRCLISCVFVLFFLLLRDVVAGTVERWKPDWPLHSEGVRNMLTVGPESKKEIPD